MERRTPPEIREENPEFDFEAWRVADRKREMQRRERIAERLTAARDEARRIATHLHRIDPAIRRVWLFGSVATGRVRNEHFDIDIAVEGATRFGALFAEAGRSDFSVDLLEVEGLKPGIVESVRAYGTLLYEKE